MLGNSRSILRFPVVAFAFLVEQLRHFPGGRSVERRAPWVIAALTVAAVVALAVWMAQRSPQRISMAELAAGGLAPMQSWIIVSGDVRSDPAFTAGNRYILTDQAVPNAVLKVTSDVSLLVGRTTVSGNLVGGNRRAPTGYPWIGQLRADPVLVPEPDPPWAAIALVAAALFIAAAGRSSYPMFFRQAPPVLEPQTTTLQVSVRREWPPSAADVLPGILSMKAGGPVELRDPSGSHELRLHSAHTSVEVGELRSLLGSEPALVLRPATGELTISFASPQDRDAAFAALVSDLHQDRSRLPIA